MKHKSKKSDADTLLNIFSALDDEIITFDNILVTGQLGQKVRVECGEKIPQQDRNFGLWTKTTSLAGRQVMVAEDPNRYCDIQYTPRITAKVKDIKITIDTSLSHSIDFLLLKIFGDPRSFFNWDRTVNVIFIDTVSRTSHIITAD